MWTFHVRCIYSVGGNGNHCSSGQQSCWVNIDTGQCRNPTRVPKSMPSDSVFSCTRPCTHFKPSGTGTPLVFSLEAEKTKFYCRPLDFWSQLTNYSFRCLIFFLINVPVNFPWQWERSTWFKLKNTLLTAADQMAVQKVRCGGRAGLGLSRRESRCSSGGPLLYSFPSGQICLWFFISVCSSSGNTWWAWSCGWNNNPVRGRVAGEDSSLTQASGSCHRLRLLYVHMYEEHVIKSQNALPVWVITAFSSIPAPHVLLLTFHSSPFRRTSIRLSLRGWEGWWRLLRRSWAACCCCRQCGGRWCARVAFSRCCWGPWLQTQIWGDCSPQQFDDLAEGKEQS